MTPTPSPITPPAAAAAAPSPYSGTAVAIGVGSTGLTGLLAYLDHILAAQGVTGPGLMANLGPILTPIWGNAPLLVVLIIGGVVGLRIWTQAQTARAAAESALRDEVHGGLSGLRSEVHGLRTTLQDHAERTDARLRSHDEGLQAVRAEVEDVSRRVTVLEKPKRRPR